MTDAALRSGTFSRLVIRRQARTAALTILSAAEDSCICTGRGRCKCAAALVIEAAERAYEEAGVSVAFAEESWRTLNLAFAA